MAFHSLHFLCVDRALTVVVCADLERLVAAHEEADLAGLLVLEQSKVSGALMRVALSVRSR